MKLLITGGAGFIGSNFIHYIFKKYPDYEIINLDALTYAGNLENLKDIENDSRYRFVKGDICDKDLVNDLVKDVDVVVNFAAESHVDRSILDAENFIRTNVLGTYNLLEAAKSAGWRNENKRFHHISTDEVFGHLEPNDPPFNESTPYSPRSPYSASKASSDHLVRAYFNTYGLPITISNCSNNYGPYMFPEKLIPLFITNLMEGKKVPVYGDGMNVRDWLYVEDHAAAIDLIFHRGRDGETYNIGGNNEWKNIDLIRLLCRLMDDRLDRPPGTSEKLIAFVKDRAGHDLRYAIDSGKLQNELGWKPSVTFEQGLARTVDWYLANQQWLDHVSSGDYLKYYENQYGVR